MARKSRTYVELEGQAETRQAFARLRFGALQNVKAQIQRSAEAIEVGAKSRVRVLSGATKEGIRIIYRDFGMSASIGSGDPNARSEEQGNVNKPAQPFLNPAFQSERNGYLRGVEDALNEAGREASGV